MKAVGIAAEKILAELVASGVTDIVSVPDTHQKSLIDRIFEQSSIRFIQVCTEDEAVGVATGLFAGGRKPMLLIQNAGLFACLNSVRGLSLDAKVPTFMLVGEYMRAGDVPSKDDVARVVHLTEPTLETWKIPFWRLESSDDLAGIRAACDAAYESQGPTVVLVGAPTV